MAECENIITHPSPVWRAKADFLVMAQLEKLCDNNVRYEWEQLWARRIDDHCFELCCIPFFAYNICIGDEIETTAKAGHRFVVTRVRKQSGHCTFRVWFKDNTTDKHLIDTLVDAGCAYEKRFEASKLIAIDASSRTVANRIANYLQEQEGQGTLVFETGLTSDPVVGHPRDL